MVGYSDSEYGSDGEQRVGAPVTGATARFWVFWVGGWVRLTLKPGEQLSATRGGETDEGYSHSWLVWSSDGKTVEKQHEWESRDCDGRMSGFVEATCNVDRLQARKHSDGLDIPDWQEQDSGQRDYAAEAAGY